MVNALYLNSYKVTFSLISVIIKKHFARIALCELKKKKPLSEGTSVKINRIIKLNTNVVYIHKNVTGYN